MSSAIETQAPPHRANELSTQVWLVKNESDQDMIIVSFVDEGDVSGIYRYEPGAAPVELDAVGMEDHANEFELGSVFYTLTGEEGEVMSPGDELVPAANRDAEMDREREQREAAEEALAEAQADLTLMVTAARRAHDE